MSSWGPRGVSPMLRQWVAAAEQRVTDALGQINNSLAYIHGTVHMVR